MSSLFTLASAVVCLFDIFLALLLLKVIVLFSSLGVQVGQEGRGGVGETGGRGRAGSASSQMGYKAHAAASRQVSLPREA